MIADEGTIKQRLAVCEKCSEKTQNLGFDLCARCGCVLQGKASIGKPTCPLNKWQN